MGLLWDSVIQSGGNSVCGDIVLDSVLILNNIKQNSSTKTLYYEFLVVLYSKTKKNKFLILNVGLRVKLQLSQLKRPRKKKIP